MKAAVGRTMTIGELTHWMMAESDDLATNLLIKKAGGPRAITD